MKNQNKNSKKITIPQARKALGFIGRNYSDEQIAEILRLMRNIAELAYKD